MSSQVTDELKVAIDCCMVTVGHSMFLKSQRGSLSLDCLYSTAFQQAQNGILQRYVPNGTVLVPGYVASATLDLNGSSIVFPEILLGLIIINGVTVGILPELTYTDLYTTPVTSLIDSLIQAIINGGSLYTAINNGDGTITVIAPGPGNAANGFIVNIIINPIFVLDFQLNIPAISHRQIIHVNDPTSAFKGYTLLAIFVGAFQYVYSIFNQAVVGNIPVQGAGIINGSGAYSLVHRESQDTLVTVAAGGGTAWIIDSGLNMVGTLPGVTGCTFAVYNPVNDCSYFQSTVFNFIKKVDISGVVTNIAATGLINLTPLSHTLSVDLVSGNVWSLAAAGATGIRIINPTTNVITPINTGADTPSCITYYPGNGTPGTERMFVSFAAVVREYDMTGTVITPTFYAAGLRAFIYSRTYNLFFASNGTNTYVIRLDGTLRQTFLGVGNSLFVEDEAGGFIIGNNASTQQINYIIIDNSGEEQFDGALEAGTPDIRQTQEDQCSTEAAMNSLAQYFKSDCGCEDCGDGTVTGGIIPSVGTYTIYSGNSANAALTNVGVEALTASAQSGYSGSYSFVATSPSEWKYVAWPSILGTPSRIFDPATGFDVAMNPIYNVTINFVVYNVGRTFYELGGAQIISFLP